ncbi:uncharacterized protein EAE97_000502 [Botrytis byssoidea]|uniref:Uncharacterized protein n=1 Tax=Botrytis byssoidea TaxID=139641 RepID=A0A9P5M4D5_9HELO|nr:uncharacterized protein EAE97_000502 [Botrytis byssoidea]KAF7955243.1 hypothetical protein EAE97_000502 [Botrytis byssoidea]
MKGWSRYVSRELWMFVLDDETEEAVTTQERKVEWRGGEKEKDESRKSSGEKERRQKGTM